MINQPFPWGRILKQHQIGRFIIVESEDTKKEISFHVYVDGKSTNTYSLTLEDALVSAICSGATKDANLAGENFRAIKRLLGT